MSEASRQRKGLYRPSEASRQRKGLYRPSEEHEACGIGMVANIDGKQTHDIIEYAITILCNLEHRGGQSADISTGDGAGILTQIPHKLFVKQCEKEDIYLPDKEGAYGVGMLFLPNDPAVRKQAETTVSTMIEEEGLQLLGWRTVPVNDSFVGDLAKKSKPYIRQVFVKPSKEIHDQSEFERKLYVIRKRIEKACLQADSIHRDGLYICSFSSKTIVYKGMLIPEQLDSFYIDLNHRDYQSALALVHSRFSTNTFPSWERAHPNRMTIHNGEFNTIKGNVLAMKAREALCQSELFSEREYAQLFPVIDESGSDSSMFDNAFEFFHLSGRSLAHTAMMMIPEPWNHELISEEKKAFYEYHSCLMEPWDGPAAVVYTDGGQIGACLDRNGLRPARYYVTKDGMIVLGSEVGALDITAEEIEYKGRLLPGKMLLVDLEKKTIVPDEKLKKTYANQYPYKKWLDQHLIPLHMLSPNKKSNDPMTGDDLVRLQVAFGYTIEEINKLIKPMVTDGKDPVGSMGYDSPLALLSKKPMPLYTYFKQKFAQVTNPPIDAIREKLITSVVTTIGPERNIIQPTEESCKKIQINSPIATEKVWRQLTNSSFKTEIFSIRVPMEGQSKIAVYVDELCKKVASSIKGGTELVILSDRGVNKDSYSIPPLLAVSGLHHYLIRAGLRAKVSILLESAEPREVHHFATLLGFGAEVVFPYLAFDTIRSLIEQGDIRGIDEVQAVDTFCQAATSGIVKIMSKMGISTLQSYQGAQVFEAVGVDQTVLDQYFTGTYSSIDGINLDRMAEEMRLKHRQAFHSNRSGRLRLESGDDFQWRQEGEDHQYNPQTIHLLQQACRTNDYSLFKQYTSLLNDTNHNLQSIRGLLLFKKTKSIAIDEVESVEQIVKRFKTGAMSYGSISEEAHEALAIAMNRLGGKSNSGEGGESPERFIADPNGDLRRSAIKQVASGRFGVNSYYLLNADEIQIKMAQGAKPGEGGHLPGSKVYPWIAEVRGSTPSVDLISPPPHHDIYSIEDLAELIHNLKNANPKARVSVKLVSGGGVGTIAAGVAKGRADLVLISGYDGGTGAAPRTSLKHAGLPWEIGLAETHQTLLLNKLRDRIVVETDGKMMTGRDVVIAALLGAEEYGFSTAPLVVLGCILMRVCHLNTCPVGVATQDPSLRKKFIGTPEHVVHFMTFIAQEVREYMAQLGIRTMDELIGRTDLLESNQAIEHWKAKGIDLSPLLYQPEEVQSVSRYATIEQVHGLDKTLDQQELIPRCEAALERKEKVESTLSIRNINRVAGTMLGSEITKRYGIEGLAEDTIKLTLIGSAGQSFGAFIPRGLSMRLVGDANDFFGKGLSGGKLIVRPSKRSTFVAADNIIIGNVAFYGATAGEAYVNGIAGERFCVRNSGANVVVEGVGDHGCEYMTGGKVVVLGETGKNFAAGMSGGVAYVLDYDQKFAKRCNQELVVIEHASEEEISDIQVMIERHIYYTKSERGKEVLKNWGKISKQFVRVIPRDYMVMKKRIDRFKEKGYDSYKAALAAFEESKAAVDFVKDGDVNNG
ncbi:glutamate synthase large subunit [Alkalihalobacillus sp. APA_J-10(15)]|nr:glutamate synthase large subunit [Halalkalibacter sp. APA_J-10(15)]